MSDTARDQAVAQMASVAAMVAALDVDYGRLLELRDERDDHEGGSTSWAEENPEDAEELEELETAANGHEDEDDAREAILTDALSVEFRSAWAAPGEELTPEEFRIVLCTGGPHVELIGDLNADGTPYRVRCLYRDWSECGELYDFDHEAALRYARELIPGGY